MRRPNASPKPFVWIPLKGGVPRKAPSWHNRFENLTGKATLVLTVESDCLFVGSGFYEYSNATLWMTFFRVNGVPSIPGTSLKGAIRSIAEAISNSCVSQMQKEESVSKDYRRCQNVENLCPACRIFGAMGFRGRVSFSDALSQGKVQTKIVQIGALFKPQKYEGRKFYQSGSAAFSEDTTPKENHQCLEVVPGNTKFTTTLSFENLTRGELGLVFSALGWGFENDKAAPLFFPKIGGAKPRCFGSVRFEIEQISLLSSLRLKPLEKDAMFLFIAQCLECTRKDGLLVEGSWEILKEKLKKPTNSESAKCPDGIY